MGTTNLSLSRDDFFAFSFAVPRLDLLAKMMIPFEALTKRVEDLDENATLAALRDTLLPRLLSGELRVPDAERFVGDVT